MLSAFTFNSIVSTQIIEGGIDAVLMDNFLHQTLTAVRSNPLYANRHILLFMDNAAVHHHSTIKETIRKFRVNLLFNCAYSPHLNPIENLFMYIKRHLRTQTLLSRYSYYS